MDVSALYPSISQDLTVKSLTKSIKESKIPWCNIDSERLGRYTSLIVDEKVLKQNKINECIPIPKRTTTLNSYTNPSKNAKETNCIAVAVSQCVRVCLDWRKYKKTE